jgi:hypothetical protein
MTIEDVLSIQAWVWDIETCWNHLKNHLCRKENNGGNKPIWNKYMSLCGNVTVKQPI